MPVGVMASAHVEAVAGLAPAPLVPTQTWTLRPNVYSDTTPINLSSSVAGRLLVAGLATRDTTADYPTPAGWTKLGASLGGVSTDSPILAVYAKVSNGAEGNVNFWTATADGSKMLRVDEFAVTVASLVDTAAGTATSGTGSVTTLTAATPNPATPANQVWFGYCAVREVLTSPAGPGAVWSQWAEQSDLFNIVWLLGGAVSASNGVSPDAVFSWTTSERARARVVGLVQSP